MRSDDQPLLFEDLLELLNGDSGGHGFGGLHVLRRWRRLMHDLKGADRRALDLSDAFGLSGDRSGGYLLSVLLA